MSGIEEIVAALAGPDGHLRRTDYDAKVHRLSIMWPSLSAALATLLDDHGYPQPGPFRHARTVLAQEKK